MHRGNLKVFGFFIITITIIFSSCNKPLNDTNSDISNLEKNKYMLFEDINFTADDIEYIEEKYIHNDQEITVNIKNKKDFESYIDNFKDIAVRKLKDGEQTYEIGIGGGEHSDTIYLKDKSKYFIRDIGFEFEVTTRKNKIIRYDNSQFTDTKHFSRYIHKNNQLPSFFAKINNDVVLSDEFNYFWNNISKIYNYGFPDVWRPTGRAILNREQNNYFEFSLSQTPNNITVYYQESTEGTKENDYRTIYLEPIKLELIESNKVILPKVVGNYYIVVKAEYENNWVEYAAFFEII